MLWTQPNNLFFKDTKTRLGGLIQTRSLFLITPKFSVYTEVEAKSKGWVADNPYLKGYVNFRAGLNFDLR
jgi:hypothetical protein